MNFLEKLTAEWYQYKGLLVRTNIKFGKNARGKGGYVGEMDVVAYDPNTKTLLHIETSTDSDTRAKREKRFKRKFEDARRYYLQVFPFKNTLKQIAVVSFRNSVSKDMNFGPGVEIKTIPQFVREIVDELKIKDPRKDAISETYPLLRAIQFSAYFK